MPENLLRQAGVDPATKKPGIGGVAFPGWANCGWTGIDIDLRIGATGTATLQQIREKHLNHDFADIAIDGRDALQYHAGTDSLDEACDLVFALKNGGLVDLLVGKQPLSDSRQPACDLLRHVSTVLVPAIPE